MFVVNIIAYLLSLEYLLSFFYPEQYKEIKIKLNTLLINYSQKYQPYMINISFKIIYFLSVCQIYIKKIYEVFHPFIVYILSFMHSILSKNDENIETKIIYFDNGLHIKTIDLINIENNSLSKIQEKFDLAILHNNKTNLTKNYYVHKFIDINDVNETTFRFLSIMLTHDNKNYEIELFNNKHNFYIIGNIIDSKFLYYYLTYIKNYNLGTKINDFKYTLEILDDNVNMSIIDEKHKIEILKDTYKIIKPDIFLVENVDDKKKEIVVCSECIDDTKKEKVECSECIDDTKKEKVECSECIDENNVCIDENKCIVKCIADNKIEQTNENIYINENENERITEEFIKI